MRLRTLLLNALLLVFSSSLLAQNLTLVSPEGLPEPYEVLPGTEVTVQWDYFGEPPVMYTHTEEPDLPAHQFFPNEAWTASADVVDNGDGTFNLSVTINEALYIWGGYQNFMGHAYSNVIHVSIASPVIIEFEDGLVCADGTGIETISALGTYDTYQWYKDDVAIDGATSMTYDATEAGSYKLEAPFEGDLIFSNTVVVTNPEIAMTGEFTQGETTINISAPEGFDSYQWLSGSDEGSLSPIDSETASTLSAEITEELTYYAVEGMLDGCTVTSAANPVSLSAFETPVITLSADSNSFGNVCAGSTISMSTEEGYASYRWMKNGFDAWNNTASLSISNTWQEGEYAVEVSPAGWPEITLVSESVDATFFVVENPQLFVDESGPYCPEQELNIVLSDVGYDYTWYMHTEFNYTDDDIIEVEGTTLTFNFSEQVRVSVEANFEGCSSSSSQQLNAAADLSPYVNFVDWNEEYLCTDSVSEMQVPSWSASNFENFQWYKDEDGTEIILEGETELVYGATEEGLYFVKADLVQCPGVNVQSSTVELLSYLDRDLNMWATAEAICEGDTVTLNMIGNSWTDIQWFEESIQIGNNGYEGVFTPMIGAGTELTQEVTEFNSYRVKARHTTCPTGIKIESNIISIKPSINPNIIVDPNYGVESWKAVPWDSAATYLYCSGEPVLLSLDDETGDYEWYTTFYAGADDYEVGDLVEGSQNTPITAIAEGVDWYTAKVEVDGCVGYSDPVLIDTWVFLPPAIASYGNGELCGEGDSTLIHNAFQGNYAGFQWYMNGIEMEGATDDTLWVTEPGTYTLTIWREECPEFGLSSGVGPTINMMTVSLNENDTVIWATGNQFATYEYQWYFNGEPIEGDAQAPWILYKDEMADGVYYCILTNPDGCSLATDEFVWSTLSLNEIYDRNLNLFPNPAKDHIILDGIDLNDFDSFSIYDITGKLVLQGKLFTQRLGLEELNKGVYLIELDMKDGTRLARKFIIE